METLGDILETKTSKKTCANYHCNVCDYICSKKYNWDRHITTAKHIRLAYSKQIGAKNEQNEPCENKFICGFCNKQYNSRNGLWKHKQKCVCSNTDDNDENIIISNEPTDKELILMLIKQNSDLVKETTDFKNMMMEVIKNGTHNTNTTTNSHNKAFNLQFFLNETCKDAMNIMDFVESIQLQLSDLEKMGEIGYVEGISNIIVKNLNALDVTQRPVHCTDKKRETIYIKDEDKWEKDDDKNKIRKVIKKVATKNARLIQKFKEKHPDYNEYHSKYSTQYHKLIIESFGGSGDNDLEKEDKIIRNITKNILVDKEP
jgi:Txe/YoeB family toxin of Txe-Axe toxin-antitoxin module